jgi:hypothetical protein
LLAIFQQEEWEMNDLTRCSLYYSHSWLSQDVDLNLAVWDSIWTHCRLMVDSKQEADPPYYISRIEDYIRRSDAFLAVLLPKTADAGEAQSANVVGDGGSEFAGSDYSLFEVHLAERARKPRLILYETQTRFVPRTTEGARYFQFDRNDVFDQSNEIWVEIDEWLRTLDPKRATSEPVVDGKAAILLSLDPNQAEEKETVRSALEAAGFTDVVDLASAVTDVEILSALRSSRLLVADVSSPSLWDVYGMAHALFIPTIRLFRGSAVANAANLPPINWGHRVGYQDDLVRWSDKTELREAVAKRATAIFETPTPIADRDDGRACLERPRQR